MPQGEAVLFPQQPQPQPLAADEDQQHDDDAVPDAQHDPQHQQPQEDPQMNGNQDEQPEARDHRQQHEDDAMHDRQQQQQQQQQEGRQVDGTAHAAAAPSPAPQAPSSRPPNGEDRPATVPSGDESPPQAAAVSTRDEGGQPGGNRPDQGGGQGGEAAAARVRGRVKTEAGAGAATGGGGANQQQQGAPKARARRPPQRKQSVPAGYLERQLVNLDHQQLVKALERDESELARSVLQIVRKQKMMGKTAPQINTEFLGNTVGQALDLSDWVHKIYNEHNGRLWVPKALPVIKQEQDDAADPPPDVPRPAAGSVDRSRSPRGRVLQSADRARGHRHRSRDNDHDDEDEGGRSTERPRGRDRRRSRSRDRYRHEDRRSRSPGRGHRYEGPLPPPASRVAGHRGRSGRRPHSPHDDYRRDDRQSHRQGYAGRRSPPPRRRLSPRPFSRGRRARSDRSDSAGRDGPPFGRPHGPPSPRRPPHPWSPSPRRCNRSRSRSPIPRARSPPNEKATDTIVVEGWSPHDPLCQLEKLATEGLPASCNPPLDVRREAGESDAVQRLCFIQFSTVDEASEFLEAHRVNAPCRHGLVRGEEFYPLQYSRRNSSKPKNSLDVA
ncbi:unnamed protein product [Vitrella brassicaformis CCMP3155]|uniref:RRM domain-containing protein n=1 Tax=Vitrella brassicaformis (strain CCMP3155) TaxID=1169540 RepID=A0A0G4EST4_VITBC|nr:unnamed protein product [Vitrella brassicaformis CCMP3155]|eukprot:CEM00766.1 unnamed protein product [Vitrella brassicaformis CCMP3155]